MTQRDASCLILTNSENKLLLQKRDATAKRYPGQWGLFGGGVEDIETPLQCLVRETKEELSYPLQNPENIADQKYSVPEWDEEGTKYLFHEKYDPSFPLTLLEGQEMKWFSLDELAHLDLNPLDKISIDIFRTKKKV